MERLQSKNAKPPIDVAKQEPSPKQTAQLQMAIMILLGFVLVVYLLLQFSTILQHILIAVFLAYLILPVHTWLMKRGLPAALSYLLITVVTIGLFTGLGFIIYQEAWNFTEPGRMQRIINEIDRMIDQVAVHFPGVNADSAKELVDREAARVLRGGREAIGTLFGFVSQAFIVLVFLIFLLAEKTDLPRRIEKGFDSERAKHIAEVMTQINDSVSRYIVAKTFACFLTGVATSLTLLVFGVENAILWGFIAFLSHYIPYIGPVVAVSVPALLAIPQFDNIWMPLLLLFLLNAWQTIIGYILEPILFGDRLNLSPFVILVSLSFWWSLWGIVGMILAVPLVAVFKIICQHIPNLKPIASLLSKA